MATSIGGRRGTSGGPFGRPATVIGAYGSGDGQARETSQSIAASDLDRSFERADRHLRLAAYTDVLRENYWAAGLDLAAVASAAEALTADFPGDPAVAELADLARTAARLGP